jgi:DNA-binding response OmpR family regulator
MKILIIEDEKLLADSIKTLLQKNGFQAMAVYDGETGRGNMQSWGSMILSLWT